MYCALDLAELHMYSVASQLVGRMAYVNRLGTIGHKAC